jgi:hypothetical protein
MTYADVTSTFRRGHNIRSDGIRQVDKRAAASALYTAEQQQANEGGLEGKSDVSCNVDNEAEKIDGPSADGIGRRCNEQWR